jgi:hypothetical protein
MMRAFALLLLLPPLVAAQPGGIIPEWEVRDEAVKLEKQAAIIEDLLSKLKPEEWVSQGAPALYVEQWKQASQFNSYVALAAGHLQRHPGRLSTVLDAFVQVDHTQSLLQSIAAGVQTYQNPGLAQLLYSAISQNSTIRETLKEYMRQLAVEREKEWEIANQEAQRCRVLLSKPRPAPAKKASPPKP